MNTNFRERVKHCKIWVSTSVFAVFTARLIMGHRVHTIGLTRKTIPYLKTSDKCGSNETLFNNKDTIKVSEL